MVRSPRTGAGKPFGDAAVGGGSSIVVMRNKGPWTEAEDEILSAHVKAHGEGNWRLIPKQAGLARCGKSCRLRWINYLRPNLKRGNFSVDEDNLILTLHALLGNRWSLIAGRIPGRTDNEIKNYWNTHLLRKLRSLGIDPTKYKVGLTLTATDTNPQQVNTDFDPSPSSSSPAEPDQLRNHTKTKTTKTATTMADSQLVSSPSSSTSTSTSYESVSGESVPRGSQLQLQEPWSSIGNSNNLQSSNNPSLADQEGHVGSGWDYDQFRMEHLQLLDPLEFAGPGTGIMQTLEAEAQVQVGKWSTASGSLFGALID